MFGDVVLGIDHEDFEHELSAIKKAAGAKFDIELTAAHLKELVTKYKVGARALVGVAWCAGRSCACLCLATAVSFQSAIAARQ
jgi:hypothetical protein